MKPRKLFEFCLESKGLSWHMEQIPEFCRMKRTEEQWFGDCVVGAGNFNWVHRSGNKYLEIILYKIGELGYKLGRVKRECRCQADFYKNKS